MDEIHFQIIIAMLLLKIPVYLSQTTPTLIVTKDYCITNYNSALAFNLPIEKVHEREWPVSHFYSTRNYGQKDEFNCNFEEQERCTVNYTNIYWKSSNSDNGEINEEITDHRWEEFKLYKSSHSKGGKTLVYKEAPIRISKEDFVIPLSIRLKNEGHIFLCEDYVTNSSCYWIMLQAWNGKTSAIRRCVTNYVPHWKNQWAEGDCQILRDSFNHTKDLISDQFWAHFQIIKDKGTIIVKHKNEVLLKFKDEQPFSARRIFYHSKFNRGLWKFHQYSYLYTDREEYFTQLGPVFNFRKGTICLAFFVVMCGDCELSIQLRNTGERLYSKLFITKNEKWEEVKIIFESEIDQSFRIYATTAFRGSRRLSTKMFWAIDNIRQCEDNEYRILISSVDDAPCQLVESDTVLTVGKTDVVSDLDRDCPENTFGENCLPCTLMGDYFCPALKYCEVINGQRSCHCTAGSHTESCNVGCPQGYYGHGCKKQCKYCQVGCESINGSCIDGLCMNGTKGIKCDEYTPYDVEGTWTDRNDLIVSWKYPNLTGGRIENFTINVANRKRQTFLMNIKSKKDYALTYTYMIKKEHFQLCKEYDVSVTIYYEESWRESDIIKIWSPPPVVNISEDAIKTTHAKTVSLIYVPKFTEEIGLETCSRKLHILISLWKDNDDVNKDINAIQKAIKDSSEFPTLHNVKYKYNINQERLPFEFPVISDVTTKYHLYLFFVNRCFGKVSLKRIQIELFHIKPAISTKDEVDSTSIIVYTVLLLAALMPLIPYLLICRFLWKHGNEECQWSLCKEKKNKKVNEIPLRDFDQNQPSTSRAFPRY